ncbi:MAG: AbrB/MazE/SpoVT family DNA-binding domain-containing protein [Kiritimatiellae bacterium]|jgi:AbrB family looped-hinge helix DNA binding protein|nr:AbrB/MazE/SpoVT family DNA-binding domain-containing protein [Kiritimatiellia bacterium]
MYTTLSSKGQVTIPVAIRNKLHLNTGDRIDFVVFGMNRVELVPKKGSVLALKGIVQYSGRPKTLAEMEAAIGRGGEP